MLFNRCVGGVFGGWRYSACCGKQAYREIQRARMTAVGRFTAGVAALAAAAALGACSGDVGEQPQSQSQQQDSPVGTDGVHGPMFPECGGISDEVMAEQTRVSGLVKTAVNSAGCQWLVAGGILGPHFSFSWFRGSPIGRERKTEELSRDSVEDITIEGHSGFIAVGSSPMLGDHLCEIGIQFNDDFIEWSVSFAQESYPPACDVAKELTRQSIVNAK